MPTQLVGLVLQATGHVLGYAARWLMNMHEVKNNILETRGIKNWAQQGSRIIICNVKLSDWSMCTKIYLSDRPVARPCVTCIGHGRNDLQAIFM